MRTEEHLSYEVARRYIVCTSEIKATTATTQGAGIASDSVQPPSHPWKEIPIRPEAGAYLSFYHSDELSHLPVRAVTRLRDNKSDPNLETLTYGLFSTCWSGMRAGVVARGTPFLFFVTRRGMERLGTQGRFVTGYYRLKWYADNVSIVHGDVALAADECYFVERPIPIREVARTLGRRLNPRSRSPGLLTADESNRLRGLIVRQPDVTPEYLEEIDRLERFNLAHGSFRYVAWRQYEPFTWASASKYLTRAPVADRRSPARSNSSPTDWWICTKCGGFTENRSLLRLCPRCNELATLRAATNGEVRAHRRAVSRRDEVPAKASGPES